MSTGVSKIMAERNHRTLMELVLKPGNDVCADCKARAPRWASYNLGIFICVNCASIHRKIGTHITKVKSITLDKWNKEQVEVMKEKGNIKSNTMYNPDEARHPPPTNMVDSDRDSELEKFIRSKYELKRFMDRKLSPPSQHLMAASAVARPRSTPLTDSTKIERKTSPGPPLPPKTPENLPSKLRSLATIPSHNVPPTRSFSQPLPQLTDSDKLTAVPPLRRPGATQSSVQKPAGQVWEDLISLQEPSQSSSLPLQYSPASPFSPFPFQPQLPVQQRPTTLGNAPNPFLNLSLGQTNATASFVASPMAVSTPGPQFPFAPSPAFYGTTNPFNQAPLATSVNGAAFPTNSNPFSSSSLSMSMATSTPATPSVQPVMALPTGALLHTPPLSFGASQISTPAHFGTGPGTVSLVQNPFAPVGAPGQVHLSTSGAPNPFSAMQMGQAGFLQPSPQPAFGTTPFLNHHQQQQRQPGLHGFGGWAE
ncbi:putative GTPase activating protein for Arf-domain-containing protein [Boletus edulis]|nr:putative GTPase activating protein for Arf-domain-containing protein [Boletus edulis]